MRQNQVEISHIGGLDGLRHILTDFYQRVFKDLMIGYLFEGQSMTRLIDREVEWTARTVYGLDITYRGKGLRQAHGKHPIRRGHFHRRNQILRETLNAHGISDDVKNIWMNHSESLIHVILGRASADQRCEQTANSPNEPIVYQPNQALPSVSKSSNLHVISAKKDASDTKIH